MTTLPRQPVLLCSPYAGDIRRNVAYAQDAMRHSIAQGEAPFASHLLYPQVLNDDIPGDREIGLACEHRWLPWADKLVVYIDLGISPGMQRAIDLWEIYFSGSPVGPIVHRSLPQWVQP